MVSEIERLSKDLSSVKDLDIARTERVFSVYAFDFLVLVVSMLT